MMKRAFTIPRNPHRGVIVHKKREYKVFLTEDYQDKYVMYAKNGDDTAIKITISESGTKIRKVDLKNIKPLF